LFGLSSASEQQFRELSCFGNQFPLSERKRLFFEKGALEFWVCGMTGEMSFFDPSGEIAASKLCPDFPKQVLLD
jgi:hypothetical protein